LNKEIKDGVDIFEGKFILKTDREPVCGCNVPPRVLWIIEEEEDKVSIKPKIFCSRCNKEWVKKRKEV